MKLHQEKLKQKYLPNPLEILLVGESPAGGRQFFYSETARCRLLGATRRAFEIAHRISFTSNREFLNYFRACGCFMDDLVHTPVSGLELQSLAYRDSVLLESTRELAERIEEWQPSLVIPIQRNIESQVKQAVSLSGVRTVVRPPLYYPVTPYERPARYVESLSMTIREFIPPVLGLSADLPRVIDKDYVAATNRVRARH